jgi:hypothetical protein
MSPVADQDDISPWARDDWSSADTPAFESLTAPIDPGRPTGPDPVSRPAASADVPAPGRSSSPRPSGAQVWIAAAFGAVLLIGGVVALVRSDSTDRQATASDGTDRSVVAPATTTATAGVPTFWNDDPVGTTEVPDDVTIAVSEVGQLPVWTDSSIDVPPPLDAGGVATEVVAFGTDGTLYRIVVPAGQVRAMRMANWDSAAQAVVGEDAMVVFTGTSLTIIRDDEPIIRVPMSGGVIFVEAWPGTERFIVTTPSLAVSGGEQQLILGRDGTLTPIGTDFVIGGILGGRAFLPDGRVAINRPGGVYAISIDQPTTRLSDGDLLAVGAAHYAVEECDESLRCAGYVIDAGSGGRTEATLDALTSGVGFTDPSSRISPDGRKVVFTDRTSGTGVRRLLDVATGATVDIGRLDEILYADSWAADSSGIFTEEGGSIVFNPVDSANRVVVEGVDGIASVATRRVPSGG